MDLIIIFSNYNNAKETQRASETLMKNSQRTWGTREENKTQKTNTEGNQDAEEKCLRKKHCKEPKRKGKNWGRGPEEARIKRKMSPRAMLGKWERKKDWKSLRVSMLFWLTLDRITCRDVHKSPHVRLSWFSNLWSVRVESLRNKSKKLLNSLRWVWDEPLWCESEVIPEALRYESELNSRNVSLRWFLSRFKILVEPESASLPAEVWDSGSHVSGMQEVWGLMSLGCKTELSFDSLRSGRCGLNATARGNTEENKRKNFQKL